MKYILLFPLLLTGCLQGSPIALWPTAPSSGTKEYSLSDEIAAEAEVILSGKLDSDLVGKWEDEDGSFTLFFPDGTYEEFFEEERWAGFTAEWIADNGKLAFIHPVQDDDGQDIVFLYSVEEQELTLSGITTDSGRNMEILFVEELTTEDESPAFTGTRWISEWDDFTVFLNSGIYVTWLLYEDFELDELEAGPYSAIGTWDPDPLGITLKMANAIVYSYTVEGTTLTYQTEGGENVYRLTKVSSDPNAE